MTDISDNPALEDDLPAFADDITNNPSLSDDAPASSEDDITTNQPADS